MCALSSSWLSPPSEVSATPIVMSRRRSRPAPTFDGPARTPERVHALGVGKAEEGEARAE